MRAEVFECVQSPVKPQSFLESLKAGVLPETSALRPPSAPWLSAPPGDDSVKQQPSGEDAGR